MKRALALFTFALTTSAGAGAPRPVQPPVCTTCGPVLHIGGLTFRDLDRDGRLSGYEDWRLPAETRARDLVSRMTLEEKAGAMMHATVPLSGGRTGRYDLDAARPMIEGKRINTFLSRLSVKPSELAAQDNALQAMAAQGRLGIPITISTDPRHHFEATPGASLTANGFSQWPEPIGFGAIGDPAVVRRFGDIARQEYRAVGIQETLSPMADLATQPLWPRINGTFGEDPALVEPLVEAYIQGFQGGDHGLTRNGVAAVVKHWVGYGAAENGFDSHNFYGRYAAFPAGKFALHLKPFEGAFAAGVSGLMPTYSILHSLVVDGQPVEQTGAGFSRFLLTDLLRGKYRYRGVIISDWAITNDCGPLCREGFPAGRAPDITGFSTAWGVESLSKLDRFVLGVQAGLDQFGGVDDSGMLVRAVHEGRLTEARLDQSVRRIMTVKFEQGLFEQPMVDASAADAAVGKPAWRAAGLDAQRRSLVLLKRDAGRLPLAPKRTRLYLDGVSAEEARRFGFEVVDNPAKATIAIMRMEAPFQYPHPTYTFGVRQHEGDLSFRDDNPEYRRLKALAAQVPVIATVYLDRPAILTNIREMATVLIVNFGTSDTALLSALTQRRAFTGHLPFELPSSMAAVAVQAPDAPHDSLAPLYPFGFGLQ